MKDTDEGINSNIMYGGAYESYRQDERLVKTISKSSIKKVKMIKDL